MKRFCLDVLVVVLSICFILCVAAIPEGVLPLMPLFAALVGLGIVIRAAHLRSVQLEQQAAAAKQQKRQRVLAAKRRATAMAQAARTASTSSAGNGLYVA
ncbi:MAG: hypothetical protein R3Y06_01465 [Faecalibacterium sp.]